MKKKPADLYREFTDFQASERQEFPINQSRLLIIGQATIDDIYREDEGFVYKLAPGGDSVYSTLGASVWPIPIMVVSRVGKDYPYEKLKTATCHPELTDWSGLRYYDGPTIHDTAYYYKDGSRKYIFEDESLLDTLSPVPSDIPECFLGCKYVHISAANVHAQLEILEFFKARGATVSLDMETHFFSGKESVVDEMLALNPVFIPSLEHVLLLSSSQEPTPLGIWPWIKEKGLSLAVVKCGGDGAWVFDASEKECWIVGVVPDLSVADVTGAGDAFCGGFMAGYMETGNPVIAAAYGSVSASFIVESWAALRPQHHTQELAKIRLDQVIRLLPEQPIKLP
jgi:ribokinase